MIREDTQRKDLLFAGTFDGLYVSFDGGKQWHSLQLNLPVTPITDIAVAHDDVVIATQGRSFWVLDDLELIRQYNNQKSKDITLYTPSNTIWPNWYGGMNSNAADGTGMFTGVNPASGMVIYYELDEVNTKEVLHLKIKNEAGELVNAFSSQADADYIAYEGAPSRDPVLSAKKGINRFVWNLRHQSLPGIPKVYIEGGFSGHKAIPGTYTFELSYGDKQAQLSTTIGANPLINLSAEAYDEYHEFMSAAEKTYTEMTHKTVALYNTQQKLKAVLSSKSIDKNSALYSEGMRLLESLKDWDALMAQRLSKAYDDVENYENGFTAYYITLINQADSSIPKITEGAKAKMNELNQKWNALHKEAKELEALIEKFNRKAFESGLGLLSN